jgi:hypothetical protein
MGTGATLTSAPANAQPPRLLYQVRRAARQHGHTEEVASSIADWCERFIRFHGKRQPREPPLAEHIAMGLESRLKPVLRGRPA